MWDGKTIYTEETFDSNFFYLVLIVLVLFHFVVYFQAKFNQIDDNNKTISLLLLALIITISNIAVITTIIVMLFVTALSAFTITSNS